MNLNELIERSKQFLEENAREVNDLLAESERRASLTIGERILEDYGPEEVQPEVKQETSVDEDTDLLKSEGNK